jgi:hypothetical protein
MLDMRGVSISNPDPDPQRRSRTMHPLNMRYELIRIHHASPTHAPMHAPS